MSYLKHIEVNGKPWCCTYCSLQLSKAARDEDVLLTCSHDSADSADRMVEFLRQHQIAAKLVNGGCPESGRTPYDED